MTATVYELEWKLFVQKPEDGPPLVRTSERNDFKRCPFLWEQTWLYGWRSRREPTWAWFGTAVHAALETYYKKGQKRSSIKKVLQAFDDALGEETRRMAADPTAEFGDAELIEARELGHAMLIGYVKEYGKDKQWDVLHTEQPFQINVPDPFDTTRTLGVYCGTWDLFVWDNVDEVYRVIDHKTAKRFDGTWRYLSINDQGGSYLWVAPEVLEHKGLLKGGEEIDGIIFNYLKKSMPDDRPVNAYGHSLNKDGSVSKVQPAPRFHREITYRGPHEREAMARRVQNELAHMDKMRRGELPIYKTPTADCNRCPIFDLCELHERGDDWQEFRSATMVRRDPYRDHREAMAEGGVSV